MVRAHATRWRARWIRFRLRDHTTLECALLGAAGAFAGAALARAAARPVLSGLSWTASVEGARTSLATIFGIQMTVLGVALTLNVLVLQVAAGQYSPRLQALYARGTSMRRVLPVFALTAGYLCAAAFAIGESPDRGEAPRPVLAGAFLLLVVSLAALIYELLSTLTQLRIEVVLRSLRDACLAAHRRMIAKRARAGYTPATPTPVPDGAAPLRAREAGYVVDVDLSGLADEARRLGVRARIECTIGDFVDDGEVVGWVFADDGGMHASERSAHLAQSLVVARARSAVYDVGLPLRLLVDITDRALSAAINDPFTARQALNECRVVLRRLACTEPGGWAVSDADGSPRVFVASAALQDHLSLVVDGPARFGASDTDTVEALLDIALEVGLASADERGRDAAIAVARRVLADAESLGGLGSARLRILRAEVSSVTRAIARGAVRPRMDARPAWGLAREPADGSEP